MPERDTYERSETPTSVYVMAVGDKTKIGMARDPQKRLRQLLLSTPGTVKLVASREFSTRPSAAHVEKQLHKKYKARRFRGEWFDIAAKWPAQALEAIEDPKLHHPDWHPDMPHEIGCDGGLARYLWRTRDRDTSPA